MFLLCVVEKSISWPVGFDWSLIKTYSMLTFSKVKNRQKGNNVIHSSSYKGAYADERLKVFILWNKRVSLAVEKVT